MGVLEDEQPNIPPGPIRYRLHYPGCSTGGSLTERLPRDVGNPSAGTGPRHRTLKRYNAMPQTDGMVSVDVMAKAFVRVASN